MKTPESIKMVIDAIESHNNVHILFVQVGGSQAWGYANEQSDVDFRFVYVRKWEHYVSCGRVPTLVLDQNNMYVPDPEADRREQLVNLYGPYYQQFDGIDLLSVMRRVSAGSSEIHRLLCMPYVYTSDRLLEDPASVADYHRYLMCYNPNAVMGTARDVLRQQLESDPRLPSDSRFWMRVRHYLSGLHEAQKFSVPTPQRYPVLASIELLNSLGYTRRPIVPDRTMSEGEARELWSELASYKQNLNNQIPNTVPHTDELNQYVHRVMSHIWRL